MRNASIVMEVEALTIVAWRMVICSPETEDSFFWVCYDNKLCFK